VWLVVYDLPRSSASARRNFYNHVEAYVRKNAPRFRRRIRSVIETEDRAFVDFICEEVRKAGGRVFVYEVVSHV
jgi:hypothetical protein